MMPRAVAAGMSTLSTPMPARPMTFSFVGLLEHLGRHLGRRADREAVIVADDAGELLSLSRPGLTSTSTPRSLKISTAAGESLSEMSTRGVMVKSLWRLPGVGAKRGCRRSADARAPSPRIGAATQAALASFAFSSRRPSRATASAPRCRRVSTVAPHQMRRPGRRVAIGVDVVGDAFLFEQRGELLGERGLRLGRQARVTAGSTTFRQTECWSGSPDRSARKSIHGVRATQSAIASALASARADQRLERRRADFAHCSASR